MTKAELGENSDSDEAPEQICLKDARQKQQSEDKSRKIAARNFKRILKDRHRARDARLKDQASRSLIRPLPAEVIERELTKEPAKGDKIIFSKQDEDEFSLQDDIVLLTGRKTFNHVVPCRQKSVAPRKPMDALYRHALLTK